MEEFASNFPFRKLANFRYLTLDVMTYVEHPQVFNFIFSLNKEARSYLQNNFITIQNEFKNEGLITYLFKGIFDDYQRLEKLYFQTLQKKVENRALTI